ncbi:MAG TPA: OmpA family protein [Kofleriaceae bacterium]|jgi:peptidoglycan-associated lipoprotein|nr:OmpA family protein [Kofleriaceae bacterium]
MHRTFSALGGGILVAAVALVFGFAMASCGDSSKKPGCKADKDCKNNFVCSANTCVECTSDAQCHDGKRCRANACVLAPECENDSECHDGKVCQAGKCKACASDDECAGGSCKAGACEPAKKCSKDDECADDEDCVNGLCRKTGQGSSGGATCALSTVYFGFDDSSVQNSERDRLGANVACIEKTKGKNVYLIGHTDTSGTEEYNIALSERRAQAVADYMARLGTDPARLQVVPKGETEPTGLGDDRDRRVEFQWH